MPKANAELFALTYGTLVSEIVKDYGGVENISSINEQLFQIGKNIGVRCVDEYLARLDAAFPSGAAVMFAGSSEHSSGGLDPSISSSSSSSVAGAAAAGHGTGAGQVNIDDVTTIGNSSKHHPGVSGNLSSSSNPGGTNPSTSANEASVFSALPACKSFRDTAESIAKIGFRMFLGVNCNVANVSNDGRSFSLILFDDPLALFVELPEEMKQPHIKQEGNDAENDHINSAGNRNNASQRIRYSNVYCGVISGALEMVNLKVDCYLKREVLAGDELNEIRVELKEVISDGAGEDYQKE